MELCVFEECELGSLERRPELSVIRFTPGFVKTLKSGPFFDECLRFPDGKRHKFAHVVCSDDADLRLEELNLECCTLPECVTKNFKCSRNSDGKDEEGLYLPGKNPEWGCEPEGCLLIERGYFQSMKGGKFLKFIGERQRGAVHWACALAVFKWNFLREEGGDLVYARAA